MSILGIDYGDKKVGLAKSVNGQALPLVILENKNWSFLLLEIKKICQQENIFQIIVGVPLSLGAKKNSEFLREADRQNEQMKKVLSFIDFLKSNLNIPVEMEDERLSTKMANSLNKGAGRKQPEDAIAAMLILQNYLDKKISH